MSAAALAPALASVATAAVRGARPAPAPAVPAQVRLSGTSVAIPRSFFGLSMEYTGVRTYEALGPLFDRVVALVRPRDGSRMLLRLGGKSADHYYWDTPTTGGPRSAFELDDAWMSALRALVARDRLRVMLDLNLAVHSPAMAVSFATAARSELPPRTLAGLEIGNEPDLYHFQGDLTKERIPTTLRSTSPNWEHGYSTASYRRDYIAYAKALTKALPNVPLGGPETISGKPQWLDAIEGLGRLDPGFLTIHRYASSNCWPKTSPYYPTVRLMLSPGASAGLANTVRGSVLFARSVHQALRLTEVNSVSCGGNTGVADSFATALWAPDALFEMINEGVASVSWHIRSNSINAPFVPTAQGIAPKPELYGLALFAQMIGANATLLGTRVTSLGPANLSAWVVRSREGERVLVINKGSRGSRVTLSLGVPQSTALVRRLTAPSVTSSTGVTLGGQSIGPDAEWQGRPRVTTVHGRGGSFGLVVPGYSAALISFK